MTAVPAAPAIALVRRARRTGRARELAVVAVFAALVVVLSAAALTVGSEDLPLADVALALAGRGDDGAVYAVRELRAPRVAAGVAVGVALGLSGAIFQAVARNVLASPDILGISAGASLAAVATLAFVSTASVTVAGGALVGAIVVTALVLGLSAGRGTSPFRMILVGIGVQLLCQALLEFLLSRQGLERADRFSAWLVGSLNNRGWDDVSVLLVAGVPLALLLAAVAPRLRMLQLGDAVASSAGVDARSSRMILLVIASALAATAVCVAGPIAFVAFIAPPLARWLTGRSVTLWGSALVGAALLVAADLAGRLGLGGLTLPVGITMGLIGGPYLLFMIVRANRVGSGG